MKHLVHLVKKIQSACPLWILDHMLCIRTTLLSCRFSTASRIICFTLEGSLIPVIRSSGCVTSVAYKVTVPKLNIFPKKLCSTEISLTRMRSTWFSVVENNPLRILIRLLVSSYRTLANLFLIKSISHQIPSVRIASKALRMSFPQRNVALLSRSLLHSLFSLLILHLGKSTWKMTGFLLR